MRILTFMSVGVKRPVNPMLAKRRRFRGKRGLEVSRGLECWHCTAVSGCLGGGGIWRNRLRMIAGLVRHDRHDRQNRQDLSKCLSVGSDNGDEGALEAFPIA